MSGHDDGEGFDECAELPDPCEAGSWRADGAACSDPDPSPGSTGDFVCSCVNGAAVREVGGPANCRIDECSPVNPCGPGQLCSDPDTTADRQFDYTCTCAEAVRGAVGQGPPHLNDDDYQLHSV